MMLHVDVVEFRILGGWRDCFPLADLPVQQGAVCAVMRRVERDHAAIPGFHGDGEFEFEHLHACRLCQCGTHRFSHAPA